MKESDRSTEKLTRGEEEKDGRKEEKGKVNGEAKNQDGKPSGPASDEKPAETNMVKSKTIEVKDEGTA